MPVSKVRWKYCACGKVDKKPFVFERKEEGIVSAYLVQDYGLCDRCDKHDLRTMVQLSAKAQNISREAQILTTTITKPSMGLGSLENVSVVRY